jgi:hypothetical protein
MATIINPRFARFSIVDSCDPLHRFVRVFQKKKIISPAAVSWLFFVPFW